MKDIIVNEDIPLVYHKELKKLAIDYCSENSDDSVLEMFDCIRCSLSDVTSGSVKCGISHFITPTFGREEIIQRMKLNDARKDEIARLKGKAREIHEAYVDELTVIQNDCPHVKFEDVHCKSDLIPPMLARCVDCGYTMNKSNMKG